MSGVVYRGWLLAVRFVEGVTVRTTLKDILVRIGSTRDASDPEKNLERLHKSLADAVALLDLEVEKLWESEPDVEDERRYQRLKDLVREANRVRTLVWEAEAKAKAEESDEDTALNLEDARDEILRRLARLAAIGDQDEVPG